MPHNDPNMITEGNIISQFAGFICYLFLNLTNMTHLSHIFSFVPGTFSGEITLGFIRMFFAVLTGIVIWFAHRYLNKSIK